MYAGGMVSVIISSIVQLHFLQCPVLVFVYTAGHWIADGFQRDKE